jgi:hypothetical protein
VPARVVQDQDRIRAGYLEPASIAPGQPQGFTPRQLGHAGDGDRLGCPIRAPYARALRPALDPGEDCWQPVGDRQLVKRCADYAAQIAFRPTVAIATAPI